jgi:hypothetical protein
MKREEAYGNALSEKQCSARNDRINEVIANFVDGSGTLTYQEIASLITRLYPASKKIHPSRG